MDFDGFDKLIRVTAVWAEFIKRAKPRHIEIVGCVAQHGPCTLIDIANRVHMSPEAVRRDLHKLGETTARGLPGDRLIEKCRPEDRKGLYFQLTPWGRAAVQEVANAIEEDENPDFYSFADDEDGGMMGDWMASRSFVRG